VGLQIFCLRQTVLLFVRRPPRIIRIPSRMPQQVLFDGAQQLTYLVAKVKGY